MTSQNTSDNSLSFSQIRGFYTVVGKHRHSISPEGLSAWQPASAVPYHESFSNLHTSASLESFQRLIPSFPDCWGLWLIEHKSFVFTLEIEFQMSGLLKRGQP